eukprot:sb/3472939/
MHSKIPCFLVLCLIQFPNIFQLQHLAEEHRCIYSLPRSRLEPSLFLFIPISLISLMYMAIAVALLKGHRTRRRFAIATFCIIATGVISTLPMVVIKTVPVGVSYTVLNVTTTTLFYINGICNPLIYLCGNPQVVRQILGGGKRRRIRNIDVSRTVNSN